MATQAIAHPASKSHVRLSRRDLEVIQLALRVLLQSSTREEHVFGAIREALEKIERALQPPGGPGEEAA